MKKLLAYVRLWHLRKAEADQLAMHRPPPLSHPSSSMANNDPPHIPGRPKPTKLPSLQRPLLLLLLLLLLLFLIFICCSGGAPAGILIRPGYDTYSRYIDRQLNKTLNPRLRHLWTTRDWDRKVRVFSSFFSVLVSDGLLSNSSRALCIGARVGQEVVALRGMGVADSIGMDLVPYPPLVVQGDFHAQPFPDDTFDFEFSNVFDHALYPHKFAGEVERTLKLGGVCVLHVALRSRGDRYSANDLLSLDALLRLFRVSDLVRVRDVDGLGLDTEVVLRKARRRS